MPIQRSQGIAHGHHVTAARAERRGNISELLQKHLQQTFWTAEQLPLVKACAFQKGLHFINIYNKSDFENIYYKFVNVYTSTLLIFIRAGVNGP